MATPHADAGLTGWETERLARLERGLAASPARVRDAALLAYLDALLDRLEAATPVRLYVLGAESPQADLLGGEVLRVRTGLFAAVAREDELAFVLAHELAHRRLGHVAARRGAEWNPERAEVEADGAARAMLAAAGFDPAAGRDLLQRLAVRHDAGAALAARLAAMADLTPATHAGENAAGESAAGESWAVENGEFEQALGPWRNPPAQR